MSYFWTLRLKAFDKVPHSQLFYKLHHYGIRGSLLAWIKGFLTNQSQWVVLDNKEVILQRFYLVFCRVLFWHLYCSYYICERSP